MSTDGSVKEEGELEDGELETDSEAENTVEASVASKPEASNVIESRSIDSPVNIRRTGSPTHPRRTDSPINLRRTDSPVNLRRTDSPNINRRFGSPIQRNSPQFNSPTEFGAFKTNRPEDSGICKFFVRGTCTWSDGCRFRHPKGDELEHWKKFLGVSSGGDKRQKNSNYEPLRKDRVSRKINRDRRSSSISSMDSEARYRRRRRRSSSGSSDAHRRKRRRNYSRTSSYRTRTPSPPSGPPSPARRTLKNVKANAQMEPSAADLSNFRIPKKKRKFGSKSRSKSRSISRSKSRSLSRSVSPAGFSHKNPTKEQVQDFFTEKESEKPLAYRRHVNKSSTPPKRPKKARARSSSSSSSACSSSSSSASTFKSLKQKTRKKSLSPQPLSSSEEETTKPKPKKKKKQPDLSLEAAKISSESDESTKPEKLEPQAISSDSEPEPSGQHYEDIENDANVIDLEEEKPLSPLEISSESVGKSAPSPVWASTVSAHNLRF